jgi:hypothetical protein
MTAAIILTKEIHFCGTKDQTPKYSFQPFSL